MKYRMPPIGLWRLSLFFAGKFKCHHFTSNELETCFDDADLGKMFLNLKTLYVLVMCVLVVGMGRVNFSSSGRVSGFYILLGSGYGSVDIFLGQQILTSGLVRVQILK